MMVRASALLILVAGVIAPTGASAQDVWETMHPNSFPVTHTAAGAQCDRTAGQSSRDALTPIKCVQFELMLASGQCEQKAIPDGTVFDYMNYQHAGQSPSVQGQTVKRLGSNTTQAAVCDLGDGVTAYWFNEGGVGCYNVAFRLPQPVRTAKPKIAVEPRAEVCEMVVVERNRATTSGTYYHVPGFHTDHTFCGPGVNIPSMSGFVPGGTINSTTYKMVCR